MDTSHQAQSRNMNIVMLVVGFLEPEKESVVGEPTTQHREYVYGGRKIGSLSIQYEYMWYESNAQSPKHTYLCPENNLVSRSNVGRTK